MCEEIQDFVFNDDEHDVMVINTGPRHGKSFTVQNFCDFYYGKNPLGHIMIGTYNEKLSTKFARTVRNTIALILFWQLALSLMVWMKIRLILCISSVCQIIMQSILKVDC